MRTRIHQLKSLLPASIVRRNDYENYSALQPVGIQQSQSEKGSGFFRTSGVENAQGHRCRSRNQILNRVIHTPHTRVLARIQRSLAGFLVYGLGREGFFFLSPTLFYPTPARRGCGHQWRLMIFTLITF